MRYLCSIRRGKNCREQIPFFFSLPTQPPFLLDSVVRPFGSFLKLKVFYTCVYARERDFPKEIVVYLLVELDI